MATTDEELSSDERPRRSVLSRSQSLPQLSHHDSGLGSYYGVCPITLTQRSTALVHFTFFIQKIQISGGLFKNKDIKLVKNI